MAVIDRGSSMKKLIAALALLSLMFLGLSPAHSDIKYTPTQKTLTDAVGGAFLLNDIQKAEIEAVVKENSNAER
jgi:hypothetical protein